MRILENKQEVFSAEGLFELGELVEGKAKGIYEDFEDLDIEFVDRIGSDKANQMKFTLDTKKIWCL